MTRARTTPRSPIPDDWQPSERAYAILEDQGIDRPFAKSCIAEFVLYWSEQGITKPGWDSAFVNSVKRDWARNLQLRAAPGGGRAANGRATNQAEMRHAQNQAAIAEWLARHNAIEGTVHVAH